MHPSIIGPLMRFAIVCAMNQNRSMEAHCLLKNRGYDVCSYGTNALMRLPGPNIATANEYSYKVTYEDIYEDLLRKDEQLYKSNGLLKLIERNMRIKRAPQYFFEENCTAFDVVITCEEKCFNAIFEHSRVKKDEKALKIIYLINVDIKDTQQDAKVGAQKIYELVNCICESESEGMEKAVWKGIEKHTNGRGLLFSILEW